MDIPFNNSKKSKKRTYSSELSQGSFEEMQKIRKKQLPKFQEEIVELLKDYDGEAITILIQKEDENGMPAETAVMMAGVTRIECQLVMAKALNEASEKALKMTLDSSKGDINALMTIAQTMSKIVEQKMEEE